MHLVRQCLLFIVSDSCIVQQQLGERGGVVHARRRPAVAGAVERAGLGRRGERAVRLRGRGRRRGARGAARAAGGGARAAGAAGAAAARAARYGQARLCAR